MSNYSLMNIVLIGSLLFFVAITLFILWKRTKERRALIKAIKDNNATYEAHFNREEEKIKKALGSELHEQFNEMVTEIIRVERDSYKKLCTVFIDHHAEAIQLLPFTMSQITASHINCLERVITTLKDKIVVEAVSLQDNKSEEDELFQYEALIEQLRFEKQSYADKCKESQHLFGEIYLKYKDKLELNNVESPHTMNIKDLTTLFKLKTDTVEEGGQNESAQLEEDIKKE